MFTYKQVDYNYNKSKKSKEILITNRKKICNYKHYEIIKIIGYSGAQNTGG